MVADRSVSPDIVLSAAGKHTDNCFASMTPTKYVQHNLRAFGIVPVLASASGQVQAPWAVQYMTMVATPYKCYMQCDTTSRHHNDVSSAHIDHPCRLLGSKVAFDMSCKCDANRLMTPQGMQEIFHIQFRHDVWH